MARRYGGTHSPVPRSDTDNTSDILVTDGAPPHKGRKRGRYDGARVDPVGGRSNIMFVPGIVILFRSLNDGAIGLGLGLASAGFLTLAAWLLREGLRAESAFDARTTARRPTLPRKILSAGLTGLGIALAAWINDQQPLAALIYGLAAAGLQAAAFGIDPLRDKGLDGADSYQRDRVAKVVDEAELMLRAMKQAVQRAGDRQAQDCVDRFQATARDLFRTVEEDPRDLTGLGAI